MGACAQLADLPMVLGRGARHRRIPNPGVADLGEVCVADPETGDVSERQTRLIRVGIAAIRLRDAEEDDARHRRDSQRFDQTIRCRYELNESIAAWRRFVSENP